MADEPIQIRVDKDCFNEKFYPHLFDYSKRWNVYMGSAGSGKSHFIAQKLIIKALNDKEGRRILVCRKTANTIRETVWRNIVDMLNFFQITDRCNINKTERVIKLPNGSEFIFQGLWRRD